MLRKFIRGPSGYAITGGVIAMGVYEALRTESKAESVSWALLAGMLATMTGLGIFIDHLKSQDEGLKEAPILEQ